MSNDNFVDAPQTIGEARADRSGKAKDWTVREMLVATLRQIDSGEIAPLKGVFVYSLQPKPPYETESVCYKCPSINSFHRLFKIMEA